MARQRKEVEDGVVAEQKPGKKLPIKRYYSRFKNYTFSYNRLDENGKPIPQMNQVTGLQVRISGKPVFEELSEKFTLVSDSPTKGYLSKCEHDPNDTDPQNVARGEALEDLHKQSGIDVWEEDVYIKKTNPAQWAERKRVADLEAKLAETEESAATDKARIAELEAALAKFEGTV